MQRPMDRGHKIFFSMAVSTIYLFPPWLVNHLSLATVIRRSTIGTSKYMQNWYFVILGRRLQAASASPVRRVDYVLTFLHL